MILQKRSKIKYIENQKIISETFKKYKKKRCQRFYFLLILAVLDLIQVMLFCFNYSKKKIIHWAFDIIIMYFISYFLLKIKLYKHHYLCIIIFAISGITYNTYFFINYNGTFIYILIDYIKELDICFVYCLIKYIMEKKIYESL